MIECKGIEDATGEKCQAPATSTGLCQPHNAVVEDRKYAVNAVRCEYCANSVCKCDKQIYYFSRAYKS